MVSVSTGKIRFSQEIVPVKVVAGQGLDAALVLGLIYLFTNCKISNISQVKFYSYLTLLNTSASQYLKSFIPTLNESNFIQQIADPSFCQNLETSMHMLKSKIFEDFPNESFINSFCQAFLVNVLIIENSSTIIRYGEGGNCIKVLKYNEDFYITVEKESLVNKLIELVNDIEDFSDRRKMKIQEIIKAHQGESKEKCEHNASTYKTICGKNHCIECLRQSFTNKTWKTARCTCGSYVSPKNIYEVVQVPIIKNK